MRDLVNLFKALSDESRLRILNLLVHTGELCVCDIHRILNFSQTKVSRHLTYLKNSGFVKDERRGMWVLYSLTNAEDNAHKRLLKELKDIFNINQELKNDILQFNKSIEQGTCTTYCTIYPKKSKCKSKS